MTHKIGVGLVGTGNIAFLHTLGYKNCDDAEIVGLCDLSTKRAISFKEETELSTNVKIYKDIDELCRDDNIDLVEILTPHASHEALAVKAAEAGKNVSVQKPPAMTLSSYDRMINAVRKAGVRFRVYENFRYHPPYAQAFKLIQDGVIGQVEAVNVRMYMSVRTLGDYRGQKLRFALHTLTWKNKDSQNYKAPTLFDDGYHKHSIVQGFLGDIPGMNESITAVRTWCGWQRILNAIKIDSPTIVIYETKKPDRYGTWNLSTVPNLPMHSDYFSCDESLEISGTDGIILVPGCTGNLFVGCDCGGPGKPGLYWFSRSKDKEPPFPNAGAWKSDCTMPTDWSQSFIDCTRHYASMLAHDDWFDDKDPRPIRAEQGRQLLQINLGVIRSLRTDGARARLADIIDGPGVSAGNETDEEDEKNELEQDNIKNMESDKEE